MYGLMPTHQLNLDLDAVARAGAELPEELAALRARQRAVTETNGTMVARLIDAVIDGDDVDTATLLTLATAEEAGDRQAFARVVNQVDRGVARRMREILSPITPGIYTAVAGKFNATAAKFIKANSVVDLETQADQLVSQSNQVRSNWLDGLVLSGELTALTPALLAAARLALGPDAESLDGPEGIAGLTLQLGTAKRRRVWEILDGPLGRCAHWSQLLAAGAVITAPTVVEAIAPLNRSVPLEHKVIRNPDGLSWRQVEIDPEDAEVPA